MWRWLIRLKYNKKEKKIELVEVTSTYQKGWNYINGIVHGKIIEFKEKKKIELQSKRVAFYKNGQIKKVREIWSFGTWKERIGTTTRFLFTGTPHSLFSTSTFTFRPRTSIACVRARSLLQPLKQSSLLFFLK